MHVCFMDLRSFEIRFKFKSDVQFEFDLKVTCRFEHFKSVTHAMCRYTTNYTHSLFNKNINLCAVCS